MSEPPNYDDHLLNRLNALKKSNIQFDASKADPMSHAAPSAQTPRQATLETDLSSRLRSLRGASASVSPSPSPARSLTPAKLSSPTSVQKSVNQAVASPSTSVPALEEEEADPLRNPLQTDDQTLEDLLAELGVSEKWELDPDEPAEMRTLLREARNVLPDAPSKPTQSMGSGKWQTVRKEKANEKVLTGDLDMSVFALNDEDEGGEKGKWEGRLEDASREAQEIVRRTLDEVKLEMGDEGTVEASGRGKEEEYDELVLPSAPSTLPEPEAEDQQTLDFATSITARMAALSSNSFGLPSAPTSAPASQPLPSVFKKFTDDEIDAWCIICQDDATVKCMGCDGDLYCAKCWKEGHMGPDVGWEEKRHKWMSFRKPK